MKKILLGVVAGIIGVAFTGCTETGDRSVTCLSGKGWKFKNDTGAKIDASAKDFNDSEWECVEVPHDWAIAGPFIPKQAGWQGKLPWKGSGWYRRSFTFTDAQKEVLQKGGRVILQFEGVMASPEVFVNGKKAGGWDYGYMRFRVDATPHLMVGENSLAVRADTKDHFSRWYPGAGIYRDVKMIVVPNVHVVPDSLFVTTPKIDKGLANVKVEFVVTNTQAEAVMTCGGVQIVDGDGEVVAEGKCEAKEIKGKSEAKFDIAFDIENPKLWDVEEANLYSAKVFVKGGEAKDTDCTKFGIRTIKFTADDGFHLNGRRVQFYGVNLHSDLGPIGMEFNRSVMKRQLEIMKKMGCNALRTSHNAPDPQVLELCDEMGILVWDECFDKWDHTAGRRKDQNLEEYIGRNFRAFIRRDRNHPSVVIWSMGNEIHAKYKKKDKKEIQDESGMTRERCALFRKIALEEDTTRPVGNGNCFGYAIQQDVFADLDITGWNYGGTYCNIKNYHPNKPTVYSESASAVTSYGYFSKTLPKNKTDYATNVWEISSHDHNAAPWSDIPDLEFFRMEKDKYCCGEFVWTGIDYLGEPTPYGKGLVACITDPAQDSRSSYFGIVDLMGIPKDRYYLYKSYWDKKEETTHILPHWNWAGSEGEKIPVYVYTSGDSAELYLNGKLIGKQKKGTMMKPGSLSFGGKAIASSEELSRSNYAKNAVDGEGNTRWCASGNIKGSWWQVELANVAKVTSVNLSFEQSAENYDVTILASKDGKKWETYVHKKRQDRTTIFAKNVEAKFFKVVFNDMKDSVWPSIREFVVSDKPVDPMQLDSYYDICSKYRLRFFDVPYEKGELKVVSYRDGKKIGEAYMRTAENAKQIKLTAEKPCIPATGKDYVFVQVDVVDAKGTRDPWAKNVINFELTGPGKIVAVGNGDPRSYESFKDITKHKLYFGKAVVVLKRNVGENGVITLKATGDGLKDGIVTFNK